MTSAASKTAAAHKKPPPPLVWRSWPLFDEKRRSLGVLAVIGAIGAIVWLVTAQGSLAGLAIGALLLAAWKLWLPVTYELSTKGVGQKIRRWRRTPWHTLGSYELRPDGALLLFEVEPQAADRLAGIFLPWGRRREEATALLEFYMAGRTSGGSG